VENEMTPILETNGLCKSFGGAQVVNGIDFRINEGETRCVIGPNGAGKSTFFKLLIGEHRPTAGSVHFQGRDISHVLPFRRVGLGMSIKFQVPGIFPDLTVLEHLKLVVHRVVRSHEVSDEIDRMLNLFNLSSESNVKAGNLSHGKKQWLEISMAVALRPKLLLLDEPVAGLSTEETEHTGELIKRLKAEGLTIMVVEHDMEFVRQVGTQVTVLHGGKVFADGQLKEVLERDDVAEIYLGKR
jgi:branched-chain amino acid transport system ATP-binding protein